MQRGSLFQPNYLMCKFEEKTESLGCNADHAMPIQVFWGVVSVPNIPQIGEFIGPIL